MLHVAYKDFLIKIQEAHSTKKVIKNLDYSVKKILKAALQTIFLRKSRKKLTEKEKYIA